MATICYYLSSILICSILAVSFAQKCIQTNQYVCEFDQDSQINLEGLLPQNKPFTQDTGIIDTNFTSYYFSGCKDGLLTPNNSNSTIEASLMKCVQYLFSDKNCTVYNSGCWTIGSAKNIQLESIAASSNYLIHYKDAKGNNIFTIVLQCTDNSTDIKINDVKSNGLTLYSPSACIRHIQHHQLSSGSIFCIIFFSVAIAYFVGGGLILHFMRGARGIEMIPNYDFWSSIPCVVKDGLVFILSGCRPLSVSTAETYDRI